MKPVALTPVLTEQVRSAILDAVLAADATRAARAAEQHARRAGDTTAARLAAITTIEELRS
jgi:DNA-binding GntR family transcriptional regulator